MITPSTPAVSLQPLKPHGQPAVRVFDAIDLTHPQTADSIFRVNNTLTDFIANENQTTLYRI